MNRRVNDAALDHQLARIEERISDLGRWAELRRNLLQGPQRRKRTTPGAQSRHVNQQVAV